MALIDGAKFGSVIDKIGISTWDTNKEKDL